MNNRVTIISQDLISGMDVLNEPVGRLLRVASHEHLTNLDDIVIRTNSNSYPLLCLTTGDLWGNSLISYKFERIQAVNIVSI